MTSALSGSFRLFRIAGIQVYLNWLWLPWGYYQIVTQQGLYSAIEWRVAEYVALFLIVLLHEFGHAFACRQTGGDANEIVLWPLGGIAFVKPPPRATAELWSIAAGPLVNVLLFPLMYAAAIFAFDAGWTAGNPDFRRFLARLLEINTVLLIFNLLPVYPLDGGQILRSLLWLKTGRARSLFIATLVGLPSILVLGGIAYAKRLIEPAWLVFMGLFLAAECWVAFRHARSLLALERMPKHPGFVCPSCHEAPPGGPLYLCEACGHRFDPFSTRGVCPHCQSPRARLPCPHCGAEHDIGAWETAASQHRGGGSWLVER